MHLNATKYRSHSSLWWSHSPQWQQDWRHIWCGDDSHQIWSLEFSEHRISNDLERAYRSSKGTRGGWGKTCVWWISRKEGTRTTWQIPSRSWSCGMISSKIKRMKDWYLIIKQIRIRWATIARLDNWVLRIDKRSKQNKQIRLLNFNRWHQIGKRVIGQVSWDSIRTYCLNDFETCLSLNLRTIR